VINPPTFLTHCSVRSRFWVLPLAVLAVSLAAPALAQRFYNPIPLTPGKAVADKLSAQDVPTGQGGFARDYVVQLQAGSQLAIDLTSDNFDSMVTLLAADGSTVAENDDGPDGTTNSLLFTRINKSGTYYIRVRAFGEVAGGNYKLKVTLLSPTSGKE
jgi:Bacterial pre-peptidase C-terminal domain